MLKYDILRTDVAKYLHIFCGNNSDIYLAGNIASIFTFLYWVGCLSCFLWCWKSFSCCFLSGKSAHLLHANHTSFSNLSFKLLLINFYADLTVVSSPNLKSELPLTVSFKHVCIYSYSLVLAYLGWYPPPFWREEIFYIVTELTHVFVSTTQSSSCEQSNFYVKGELVKMERLNSLPRPKLGGSKPMGRTQAS